MRAGFEEREHFSEIALIDTDSGAQCRDRHPSGMTSKPN